MAVDTPLSTRNLVIYEIYVRSHGTTGRFADVEADLPRIRSLGVDVIWFMPIHPIGADARKGSRGSPYAIGDYRAINPEYGTLEDFTRLVDAAHALGLKVMIDVVYNHTAHDSRLVREHPEWFHQDECGRPVTTVPEWSDVIDLAHPNPALADELIDTLCEWVRRGVDGFRCDVAPLVPIEFWQAARRKVAEVKPGVLWLAESVHIRFLRSRRAAGLTAHSDAELYAAFDLTYDYDLHPAWQAVVAAQAPVARYLDLLAYQDGALPANYAKLRWAENHDNARIQALAPTPAQARAWTAWMAFLPGAFLIYAGQEAAATQTPSLFETEPIAWNGFPLQTFLTRLARLKKHPAQRAGSFRVLNAEPALTAAWQTENDGLFGLFNVEGKRGSITVPLPDGRYEDLLNGGWVAVSGGCLSLPADACVLAYPQPLPLVPYRTLLD